MVVLLTLASGYFDARGFLHASRMWSDEGLVGHELALSAGGFALGISCYWLVVRFARYVGVLSAEAQTLGWFCVTIVGVAVMSGDFAGWTVGERGLAVMLVVGLGVLLYRTSV